MTRFFGGAACAALLCSVACAFPALAQDSLKVHVPVGQGSPAARGTAHAERQIEKIPGGADIVPASAFKDKYALSMKDMLATTPGVLAQPRYGEESRLSIRGSGLSRSVHLRGITILQNGVPINFPDGSGDFQEIDPLILQHIEVYRGGQGLRYGSATLGGAVNLVTPTARTVDYNGLLRAEGGSFSTGRLHAQAAKAFDNVDMLATATKAVSDGFRQNSGQDNLRFSGNAGIKLGDRAETRFYANWNDIRQEVPGTITKSQALNTPKIAPAINLLNEYGRDIHSLRLANRTAFTLDNGLDVEFGGYMSEKSLYHPIFQVIDQTSLDLGTFARASGDYDVFGHRNEFTAGINLGRGRNDAKRFINNRGTRGALTADAEQVAQKVELYGENRFYVSPAWSLIAGAQATAMEFDYRDQRNDANSAGKTYTSLNPKFGVMWELAPETQVFASVTRSSEAPTFSELVQGAIPGFVPVDLQKAWTAEFGTRGRQGAFSWDVTAYRSHVTDELLNFTVTQDVPASTFNADETIHQGIEFGGGWQATEQVSFSLIYNLNDFSFEDDAQFGDNDLAGAPRHQMRFAARFGQNGYFIEPNVEWIPEAPYVDYANTLKADDYALLGVNAGWDINDRVSVFVDARNLTDKKTIATFSTITDARTAATNVFYPNDGRSVFAGVRVKF